MSNKYLYNLKIYNFETLAPSRKSKIKQQPQDFYRTRHLAEFSETKRLRC